MSFPQTWEIRRTRFSFQLRDVRGVSAPLASATKDGVFLRSDLDFSVWNPASDISNYKLVEPDDFVIGLRSFQHGISHSAVRGLVSPAYTVLRSIEGLTPGFYKHYFRSSLLVSQLANITQGIRQGQTIDTEAFLNLKVPIPPPLEQRRIADFLDAETARIDALTSAKLRQSACFGERWAAKLADEVDLLLSNYGAVPLRRFTVQVEQGWSPQCEDAVAADNEWAVLKTSSVSSGHFMPLEHKKLPGNMSPDRRYEIRDGDLLLTRGSGSPEHVGMPAVAHTDGKKLLLSDLLYRISSAKLDAQYLAFTLQSEPVRASMATLFRGQSGQTIKLRSEDIKSILIPAAPRERQRNAARTLMDAQTSYRAVRQRIDTSVLLLQERRQALITAAVTGQFDVSTASGRGVTE